jgi:hypothetical protein
MNISNPQLLSNIKNISLPIVAWICMNFSVQANNIIWNDQNLGLIENCQNTYGNSANPNNMEILPYIEKLAKQWLLEKRSNELDIALKKSKNLDEYYESLWEYKYLQYFQPEGIFSEQRILDDLLHFTDTNNWETLKKKLKKMWYILLNERFNGINIYKIDKTKSITNYPLWINELYWDSIKDIPEWEINIDYINPPFMPIRWGAYDPDTNNIIIVSNNINTKETERTIIANELSHYMYDKIFNIPPTDNDASLRVNEFFSDVVSITNSKGCDIFRILNNWYRSDRHPGYRLSERIIHDITVEHIISTHNISPEELESILKEKKKSIINELLSEKDLSIISGKILNRGKDMLDFLLKSKK